MVSASGGGSARAFSASSSVEDGIDRFLQHLKEERNCACHTLDAYGRDLRQFVRYLYARNAASPLSLQAVQPAAIADFLDELSARGLKHSSIARKLTAIRSFFRYLCREQVLSLNPSGSIRAPKVVHQQPRSVALGQIERAIDQPTAEKFEGARDRAILDVFYGGGIRLSELVELNLSMLDLDEGNVRVACYGGRERIVPVGRLARESLASYLRKRTDFLVQLDISQVEAGALFLNRQGRRLSKRTVQRIVKRYLSKVVDGRHLSPNLLRHTFAVHLLEAGADLADVKELLGHVTLAAARTLKQVDLEELRQVYAQAHPRS